MSPSKSLLCFVLVTLICNGFASNVEKRGHHNSGGWGTLDCWDKGDNHVMNPFCATLEVCLTPIGILHGSFSKPEATLQGVQVAYTCDPGYQMIGQSLVLCTQAPTPKWGPLPKCVKPCPAIPAIANGSFKTPASTVFGTVVNYVCDMGYSFENGSTVECLNNGEWSQPLPVCLPIVCSVVPTIANGSFIAPNETSLGTVVDYVCDMGFSFENGSSVVCLVNGQWSRPLPVCLPTGCPDVPPVDNGFFQQPNDTSVGTLVEYQCNQGFNFENESTILCLDTSRWSTPSPICLPSFCPPIPVIEHGIFQPNVTDVGTLVEYECNKGYAFENTSTIICTNDGKWSWPIPKCLPTACPPYPNIYNGYSNAWKNMTDIGTLVEYQCNPGFGFDNNDTIVCLENGKWSQPTPNCVPLGCPPYPDIDNGFSNSWKNMTDAGTLVEYQCFLGYQFENNSTIVCLDSGEWSQPTPVCKPIECSPIPTVDHATVAGLANGTYGFKVDYVCDDGFEFVDTSSTTCLITGAWSALPVCNRTGCGSFPVVDNGTITEATNDTSIGALAMYKCDVGFEIYGNKTIECLVTYEWTQPPNCDIVCGQTPVVANAKLTSQKSSNNGDTLQYACDPGFAFIGGDSVTCANGTWTELPVCQQT